MGNVIWNLLGKLTSIYVIASSLIIFSSCSSAVSKEEIVEETRTITIHPKNAISSGHELVIIPSDPMFSPNDRQISDCINFLKKEYPELIIRSKRFDSVQFVDGGQNFESVSCNLCATEMNIEFWQEQMSRSYEHSNFEDLLFVNECCNEGTSLNDLVYSDGSGFSSYEITINNLEPNDTKERRTRNRVSKILKVDTKVFWRHL
jgi:hypothetical protein